MDIIDNIKLARLLENLHRADEVVAQIDVQCEQGRRRRQYDMRAMRTRLLIELGGLVVIAGLLDADKDVVLGALVRASSRQGNITALQKWRRSGQAAFDRWEKTGRSATWPEIQLSSTRESPAAVLRKFTQTLIEWGGIITKAGLAEWDAATILGVLLAVAAGGKDPARADSWRRTGEDLRKSAAKQESATH